MSSSHYPEKPIAASELFDGRLDKFGVREFVNESTDAGHRILTDDNGNSVSVWIGDDGNIEDFSRSAPNGNPSQILGAVREAFDVDIFSENDPQFWGFETQEEWDEATDAMAKEQHEKNLVDLRKYLRGEKHGFRKGTIG